MLKPIVVILVLAAAQAASQQPVASPQPVVPQNSRPTLTKEDVVKLVKAGLGEALILIQIQVSGTAFALSADDMITLSKDGVSSNILSAMIRSGAAAPVAAPPEPAIAPSVPAPGSNLAGSWKGAFVIGNTTYPVTFSLYGKGPHFAGNATTEYEGRTVPSKIMFSGIGAELTGVFSFTLKAGAKVCRSSTRLRGSFSQDLIKATTFSSSDCSTKTEAGTFEVKKQS